MIKADLDDKSSLVPALEGATAIFSNTDFFVHFFEALQNNKVTKGRTPNEYAHDREVEQGVHIAEVAASPEVLRTLTHFIYSSLSGASKWSKGKYTQVYHNDSKEKTIQTIRSRHPDLATRMSTVQIGFYVRNWHALRTWAPQKQADGSYIQQSPFGPDYVNPFVVPHEDTGAFVQALVDLPPGKNLLGVSDPMTWPEYTKIWGDVMGVKIAYQQLSKDVFLESAPEVFRTEFIDGFNYLEEFGHTGGDPDVMTGEQVSHPLLATLPLLKS